MVQPFDRNTSPNNWKFINQLINSCAVLGAKLNNGSLLKYDGGLLIEGKWLDKSDVTLDISLSWYVYKTHFTWHG